MPCGTGVEEGKYNMHP